MKYDTIPSLKRGALDKIVNSRIRQIVILFRKCLAIKEAMSYGTVF